VAPGVRVLLAEDDLTNQVVASRMLERLGYPFDVVADGMDAFEAFDHALEAAPYGVVLMDCHMPRLDGYDATRLIRERERELGRPRTPVLAVTAMVMSEERERARLAGMDGVVPKPLEVHVLGAAIAQALRAPGSAAPEDAARPTPAQPEDTRATLSRRADELRAIGGEEMLLEIYASFLATAESAVDRMSDAIRGADARTLKEAAHRLKGTSLNVGASALAEAARRLELLGREGRTEGAEALLRDVLAGLSEVREELSAA
jgi:CheY-like chemotaxis protein/HPt (histidine-containing phosphotransfer) domain-containing protein